MSNYYGLNKKVSIAAMCETEEGRIALAQAMVEPIKRNFEYKAIGRKLLMVEELPQGVLTNYERDVASTAYIIGRRGKLPDRTHPIVTLYGMRMLPKSRKCS